MDREYNNREYKNRKFKWGRGRMIVVFAASVLVCIAVALLYIPSIADEGDPATLVEEISSDAVSGQAADDMGGDASVSDGAGAGNSDGNGILKDGITDVTGASDGAGISGNTSAAATGEGAGIYDGSSANGAADDSVSGSSVSGGHGFMADTFSDISIDRVGDAGQSPSDDGSGIAVRRLGAANWSMVIRGASDGGNRVVKSSEINNAYIETTISYDEGDTLPDSLLFSWYLEESENMSREKVVSNTSGTNSYSDRLTIADFLSKSGKMDNPYGSFVVRCVISNNNGQRIQDVTMSFEIIKPVTIPAASFTLPSVIGSGSTYVTVGGIYLSMPVIEDPAAAGITEAIYNNELKGNMTYVLKSDEKTYEVKAGNREDILPGEYAVSLMITDTTKAPDVSFGDDNTLDLGKTLAVSYYPAGEDDKFNISSAAGEKDADGNTWYRFVTYSPKSGYEIVDAGMSGDELTGVFTKSATQQYTQQVNLETKSLYLAYNGSGSGDAYVLDKTYEVGGEHIDNKKPEATVSYPDYTGGAPYYISDRSINMLKLKYDLSDTKSDDGASGASGINMVKVKLTNEGTAGYDISESDFNSIDVLSEGYADLSTGEASLSLDAFSDGDPIYVYTMVLDRAGNPYFFSTLFGFIDYPGPAFTSGNKTIHKAIKNGNRTVYLEMFDPEGVYGITVKDRNLSAITVNGEENSDVIKGGIREGTNGYKYAELEFGCPAEYAAELSYVINAADDAGNSTTLTVICHRNNITAAETGEVRFGTVEYGYIPADMNNIAQFVSEDSTSYIRDIASANLIVGKRDKVVESVLNRKSGLYVEKTWNSVEGENKFTDYFDCNLDDISEDAADTVENRSINYRIAPKRGLQAGNYWGRVAIDYEVLSTNQSTAILGDPSVLTGTVEKTVSITVSEKKEIETDPDAFGRSDAQTKRSYRVEGDKTTEFWYNSDVKIIPEEGYLLIDAGEGTCYYDEQTKTVRMAQGNPFGFDLANRRDSFLMTRESTSGKGIVKYFYQYDPVNNVRSELLTEIVLIDRSKPGYVWSDGSEKVLERIPFFQLLDKIGQPFFERLEQTLQITKSDPLTISRLEDNESGIKDVSYLILDDPGTDFETIKNQTDWEKLIYSGGSYYLSGTRIEVGYIYVKITNNAGLSTYLSLDERIEYTGEDKPDEKDYKDRITVKPVVVPGVSYGYESVGSTPVEWTDSSLDDEELTIKDAVLGGKSGVFSVRYESVFDRWFVSAVTGLEAGTYTDTLAVTFSDGQTRTVKVSFTVEKKLLVVSYILSRTSYYKGERVIDDGRMYVQGFVPGEWRIASEDGTVVKAEDYVDPKIVIPSTATRTVWLAPGGGRAKNYRFEYEGFYLTVVKRTPVPGQHYLIERTLTGTGWSTSKIVLRGGDAPGGAGKKYRIGFKDDGSDATDYLEFSDETRGRAVNIYVIDPDTGEILGPSAFEYKIDMRPPVIEGADEGKTYTVHELAVTVTDDNLKSVMVNGVGQTFTGGKLVLNLRPAESVVQYKIVAVDEAGLTTTRTFTIMQPDGASSGTEEPGEVITPTPSPVPVSEPAEDDVTMGEVIPTVQLIDGAPRMSIATGENKLITAILSSDEINAVKNGSNLAYRLLVRDIGASVSQADKETAFRALDGYTIGQYLTISLFKTVGSGIETPVVKTSSPISLSLTVPESLRDEDAKRSFAMLKITSSDVKLLEDQDSVPYRVTISTDAFDAIYVLAYKENARVASSASDDDTKVVKVSAETDGSPETGDGAPLLPIELVCGISLIGLIAAIIFRYRANYEWVWVEEKEAERYVGKSESASSRHTKDRRKKGE